MAQRPRDCGGRAVVPRAHNTPAGSDSGDSMLAPPSGSCSRPSRRWPRRIPHVFFIFLNFNLSRASRPPHRAPTPRVGRCQSCLLVIVSQCLLSSARSHAPVTRRAQQRAPAPRTSSRSTSGRAGRASLETAGGCQCCPYTRTDRYHRVSVQQQHASHTSAAAVAREDRRRISLLSGVFVCVVS